MWRAASASIGACDKEGSMFVVEDGSVMKCDVDIRKVSDFGSVNYVEALHHFLLSQRNRICTLYVTDKETFFKEFASA